jgi:hypothetical protein
LEVVLGTASALQWDAVSRLAPSRNSPSLQVHPLTLMRQLHLSCSQAFNLDMDSQACSSPVRQITLFGPPCISSHVSGVEAGNWAFCPNPCKTKASLSVTPLAMLLGDRVIKTFISSKFTSQGGMIRRLKSGRGRWPGTPGLVLRVQLSVHGL